MEIMCHLGLIPLITGGDLSFPHSSGQGCVQMEQPR